MRRIIVLGLAAIVALGTVACASSSDSGEEVAALPEKVAALEMQTPPVEPAPAHKSITGVVGKALKALTRKMAPAAPAATTAAPAATTAAPAATTAAPVSTTAAPVWTTASCQLHACGWDYESVIRGNFLRECERNGGTWSGCRKVLECIEYRMPQAKFEYEENFMLLTGEFSDEMAHVMASCLTYS